MACVSASSYCYVSMLSLLLLCSSWYSCYGVETFKFDIYHRYSDPVKRILAVDHLPKKGSLEYYTTMVHHDRRRLAMANDQTPVTFLGGNKTFLLPDFGYLYYVNVSVGTPSVSFLVALDTGSNWFWLPCNCINCVRNLETPSGQKIPLSIYSPNASSTSAKVPCNSTLCEQKGHCFSASNACPYQVHYVAAGTSTTGILVEDVLHLTTDNNQSKVVDAPITFGCGQVQTGLFLLGAAFNGLLGLGMDNKSVPSNLARQGLASNSFSMCFGPDGIGRISFGDKGSLDQGETPLNLGNLHSTYNVSITKMIVGDTVVDHNFSAIVDSGTSITHLSNPAYSLLSQSFNSHAKEMRHASVPPYDFCYDLGPNQTTLEIPTLNLTLEGGDPFYVINPIIMLSPQGQQGEYFYCLGVVRSEDLNIIGENFLIGYHIVFDREKMVLGWKASECSGNDAEATNSTNSPPVISPTAAVTPEANPTSGNTSHKAGVPMPLHTGNYSPQLKAFTYTFMMVLIPFFSFV